MKKTFLFIALSIISFSSILANEVDNKTEKTKKMTTTATVSVSVLSGTVIDTDTDETLAGAEVIINGQKVYTDLDGNFTVKNLNSKNCQLEISLISYNSQVVKVDATKQNKLNIKLKQI